MLRNRLGKFRYSLKSVLILMLGVAIGYSLNLETLRLITGRAAHTSALPAYVIAPPDLLQIEVYGKNHDAITTVGNGQHYVGPDGRVNLGTLGSVVVAGKTIDQARAAVKKLAAQSIESPEAFVDVIAQNSKFYYLIEEKGKNENVSLQPFTGNETVLDAIAQIGGIKAAASTNVYVVRPLKNGLNPPLVLPVDWSKIASGESDSTNHHLLPGDRVYISSNSVNSTAN